MILCSGAWIDVCIRKGITELLSLDPESTSFQHISISGIEVDLATCFSYADADKLQSIEQRRDLLVGLIGIHAQDPRLRILPEKMNEEVSIP